MANAHYSVLSHAAAGTKFAAIIPCKLICRGHQAPRQAIGDRTANPQTWRSIRARPLLHEHEFGLRLGFLEENLSGVDVMLSATDLGEIGTTLSKIEVQGERLPDTPLKMAGL